MVREGGSIAKAPPREGGDRRRAVGLAGVFALAAVAAVCMVYVDGGSRKGYFVGTERRAGGDVLLSATKPHDLHFTNSLREPEEVEKDKEQAASDQPHEQLVQAKMNADKAMRGSHKGKESAQMREEAKLKAELDADTKRKQVAELRGDVQGQDMKQLLRQDRGAIKAKEAEHKAPAGGKAKPQASADAREEAALRAKLNSEVKRKQAQLFEQGQHSVHMKGGAKSIAQAQALDGSGKKLTEAQLEAQLRSSLNAKVDKERTHMFKSALQTYLAESSGVKALAHAAPASAGTPAGSGGAGGGKGGPKGAKKGSSSLEAAERIMKMSLEVSKGSSVHDTTLQHKALGGGKRGAAAAKAKGLATLEAAMLKSTMSAAKHDAPAIEREAAAKRARKEAALRRAAAKQAAKPSYHDAMMAFSKRLVTKEKGAKQKYEPKPKPSSLAQAGVVDKKRLENAIRHKVEARLAKGSPALAAERAELAKQFSGAHSMFGRAEHSELTALQRHRQAALLQTEGGGGGGTL